MQFCSRCGHQVSLKIPPGETLLRHVCDQCQMVHYQNPKLIVGSIPEWKSSILLCKRAIEPRYGYWTLPAGFMENQETTSEGAIRETLEETGAQVQIESLFSLFNLAHLNQVHLFYRARVLLPVFGPTTESTEVALFQEGDIPWQDLAFVSVRETLAHFFEDRKNNRFILHQIDLDPAQETTPLSISSKAAG
ncbi:MAG: zinc ribbon domain-containing protein [Proteobacteria bacterium]|nr:zinc ribbon domain-containing protein [Pseudomonadota bacterium]